MNTQNANVQNNLQGQMAQAILNATKDFEQEQSKPVAKEDTIKGMGHPPMIVCRVDLLSNKVVFLVATQSKDGGTIQMWDGKKGSKAREVSIEYYKSTRPIDNETERNKLVQDFSREFRVSEVIVRQRLLKSNLMERDAQGQVEKVDVDAFKKKLIEAVTKAILEV